MDNWNELIKLYNNYGFKGIEQSHGTIFHYTSPEGLIGIFDSNSLFATDMYFLNDASEGMYVVDLMKQNIDELCKRDELLKHNIQEEIHFAKRGKWDELIHNYSISFSCNGDSLEMWNYYTKGNSIQGYNIGFDIQKLADSIQIEILDDKGNQIKRNDNKHLVLYQGKVIYDIDKQLSVISNIFDIFYNKYLELNDKNILPMVAHLIVAKAMSYGQFFKSPQFEIEEEYRFIYSTFLLDNNSDNGIPAKEQFRILGGRLIPYQKCKFDMSSIDLVTFSPSLHNEMAEAGLNRLLKKYGIEGENKIKISDIPLRF